MADFFSHRFTAYLILTVFFQLATAEDDEDVSSWWTYSVYIWFALASFVLMFGVFLVVVCIRCYKMKRARIAAQNSRQAVPLNAYPRNQNTPGSNDHQHMRAPYPCHPYPYGMEWPNHNVSQNGACPVTPIKPPPYQLTADQGMAAQCAPPSYDQLYSAQHYSSANELTSSAPTANQVVPSASSANEQNSFGMSTNANIPSYPNAPLNNEPQYESSNFAHRGPAHPPPGSII